MQLVPLDLKQIKYKTMKTLKTNLLFILVALLTLNACAETKEVRFNSRKFIKHYKEHGDVISFSLPPALLRVFIDREDKELKELLRQIDDMRFLIFDDESFNETSPRDLFKKMDMELTENNFQDLLIVKEKNEIVKFKILETDAKVKELILLVSGGDELVLMNLSGNIDLNKMDIITESFDVHRVHDYK